MRETSVVEQNRNNPTKSREVEEREIGGVGSELIIT